MRQRSDARMITVNKAQLIEQIKANKAKHIEDYTKAVEAYRVEAKRQLKEQAKQLEKGSLMVRVHLVTPVLKSDEYDKILAMFEWEQAEVVELSQGEFNEYVLDETQFSIQSKAINSTYLHLG